ncbi:MAG TPA: VRR-NUC domain-containing protein [Deinococcales bacterium]|nr:VRR-NUC domain-containing protein [Deinococcales bacterium]
MARRPEHLQQVALFEWAARQERRYPALRWLHAIPNGGLRHVSVALELQAEGVKAGVPDVFLPAARGGWHGLYVEMKVGKNRPTAQQRDFIATARAEGYRAEVCYSWTEAARLIEVYLTARPGARLAMASESGDNGDGTLVTVPIRTVPSRRATPRRASDRTSA